MVKRRLGFTLEFRDDALGQYLAQFHTPLIERVNAPDCSLRKHALLVEGNQFAERLWSEPVSENCVRRPIALTYTVGYQPSRRALSLHLFRRPAKRQRLALSKDVRQQHIVMAPKRVERLAKCDEVAGDESCPLMDQLVERVLTISSRLTPINRTCGISHLCPVERDVFAVALHRQLLEISRESFQILLVWQNRNGLGAKEVVVPNREQAHEHWQVALERSRTKVLVHLMEAIQHGSEILLANRQHRRKTDR